MPQPVGIDRLELSWSNRWAVVYAYGGESEIVGPLLLIWEEGLDVAVRNGGPSSEDLGCDGETGWWS